MDTWFAKKMSWWVQPIDAQNAVQVRHPPDNSLKLAYIKGD
jgi:hypothetical protein